MRDHPRLQVVIGTILDPAVVLDCVSQSDRVFHLAAAVGGQDHRRRAVDEPPGEHPRHGERADGLRGDRCDPAPGLDQRDLRQERIRQPLRRRRPHPRFSAEVPLGLRRGEGNRRGLRPRLLEPVRAARLDRAAVQHRGPAAEGTLRHGRAEPRRPGPARGTADGLRNGQADPMLLLGHRHRAGHRGHRRVDERLRPGLQPRRGGGDLHPRSRAADHPRDREHEPHRAGAVPERVRRRLRRHAAAGARQHPRPRTHRIRSAHPIDAMVRGVAQSLTSAVDRDDWIMPQARPDHAASLAAP